MDIFGITLNWIDGGVFIIVVFCMLLGLLTGLVMQLAGILSVMAGMAASLFIGPLAATALGRWIENEHAASFLAYIGCFTVAATLVRVLAGVLNSILKNWKLERFDRLAGGLVGAVKGLLICAVLLAIAGNVDWRGTGEDVKNSFTGSHILASIDKVMAWADENDVTEKAKKMAKKAREASAAGSKKLQDSLGEKIINGNEDEEAADETNTSDGESSSPNWNREP